MKHRMPTLTNEIHVYHTCTTTRPTTRPTGNRHVNFDGRLQHGVVGELSNSGASGEKRTTFLVNWWTEKPMRPNCNPLGKEWKRMGFTPMKVAKKALRETKEKYMAHVATPIGFGPLDLTAHGKIVYGVFGVYGVYSVGGAVCVGDAVCVCVCVYEGIY